MKANNFNFETSEILKSRAMRLLAKRYRQALQEGTLIQKEGIL